jgi:hypothetical protein
MTCGPGRIPPVVAMLRIHPYTYQEHACILRGGDRSSGKAQAVLGSACPGTRSNGHSEVLIHRGFIAIWSISIKVWIRRQAMNSV